MLLKKGLRLEIKGIKINNVSNTALLGCIRGKCRNSSVGGGLRDIQ